MKPSLVGTCAMLLGCATKATQPSAWVVAPPQSPPATATQVPEVSVDRSPTRRAAPRPTKATVVDGTLGLFVGQPIASAEQLVGGPVTRSSREQEVIAWQSSGYVTDEEPIFALGFDEVSEFHEPKLPVFKIYSTAGNVRVIKVSSYVLDLENFGRRVGFEPSCFLMAPGARAVETFGEPFFVEEVPAVGEVRTDRRVVYHFVEQGLSVLAEEGAIRVFDIYGLLAPADERRVRDALARKRRKSSG